MVKYQKSLFTLVGIATGVFLVHPYVMLVHQFIGFAHGAGNGDEVLSGGGFAAAFSPAMLPMTLAFGFFAGACGFLLGLLFERNQRVVQYRYQARMHRDLTASLNQLLGVISHYILNSSMMISGYVRRLQKSNREEDRKILSAIADLAQRNEAILKLMQGAEFLQNIDPSDNTYQKLIDLNQQVEKHLQGALKK